jgi:hypothetical protein
LQRQSKENWCLPELLRVKAQTIAALGERDVARAMLRTARENALTIGARTLELRIVNDMTQMAIAEGNNEEAVELLVPVYESFGDATATEDLKISARLLTAAGANRAPMPLRDKDGCEEVSRGTENRGATISLPWVGGSEARS